MSSLRFERANSERAVRVESFPYSSAYTAIFWFYISSDTDAYPGVFSVAYDYSTGAFDRILIDPDLKFFPGVRDDSTTDQAAGTTLYTGVWYKGVVLRESASSCKFYCSAGGVALNLEHTATLNITGRTAAEVVQMAHFNGYFDGRVAGLRMWTAALTLEEIATEFTSATAVKTANLWVALPVDDSSVANLLNDQSANNRDFTENGTLSLEAAPTLDGASSAFIPRRMMLGVG